MTNVDILKKHYYSDLSEIPNLDGILKAMDATRADERAKILSPSPVSKDKTDETDEEILRKHLTTEVSAIAFIEIQEAMSEARSCAVSSLTENNKFNVDDMRDAWEANKSINNPLSFEDWIERRNSL